MSEVNVVSKRSLAELEKADSGIGRLLENNAEAFEVDQERDALGIFCNPQTIKHPEISRFDEHPTLVLSLPSSTADDVQALIAAPLRLHVISESCTQFGKPCLEMTGAKNLVQLDCDNLLPFLRKSGWRIYMIIVCGDDVYLVKHDFPKELFLDICHLLRKDLPKHRESNPNRPTGCPVKWYPEKIGDKRGYMAIIAPSGY